LLSKPEKMNCNMHQPSISRRQIWSEKRLPKNVPSASSIRAEWDAPEDTKYRKEMSLAKCKSCCLPDAWCLMHDAVTWLSACRSQIMWKFDMVRCKALTHKDYMKSS
jgi:hypothetical protein